MLSGFGVNGMSYSEVRGIIFDLGSTLIEFENRSWTETTLKGVELGYHRLAERDYILPDFENFALRLMTVMDELRTRAYTTYKERQATDAPEFFFSELGFEKPKELSRWFMDEFYRAVTDQMTSCEGAVETLREIKRRGYKTGLISNTPYPRSQHEADLDRYGMTPYLDFRIYSSEFGVRKPHPDIFMAGLEKIELPPEATIYVGDSFKWDIKGAENVGMCPVLKYREGRDYPDPLPDTIPVIHNLAELLDLLDH
jgi:putative hydrolase of the HAD superfamily